MRENEAGNVIHIHLIPPQWSSVCKYYNISVTWEFHTKSPSDNNFWLLSQTLDWTKFGP